MFKKMSSKNFETGVNTVNSEKNSQIIEIDQKESQNEQPVLLENNEVIDYNSKDYESFRSTLLQLVSKKLPDWNSKSESDTRMVLLDIFSYVADELSYYQDRVANEAFLRTARKKFSVGSHLRLLDYKLHNGCSATTFLKMLVDEIGFIPKGFQTSNRPIIGSELIVFETDKGYKLTPDKNEIKLFFGKKNKILSKGSTSAEIKVRFTDLQKGDYILFENNENKEIVQLNSDPILIKSLRIPSSKKDSSVSQIDSIIKATWDLEHSLRHDYDKNSKVCANIVRVTQGQSIVKKEILIHGNIFSTNLRFKLKNPGVAFVSDTSQAYKAKSTLQVWVDGEKWEETDDLLECGAFEKCFLVNIDDDGFTEIQFGDGIHGKKPYPWSTIEAKYRISMGSHGNVGEKILTEFDSETYDFIKFLENPIPATDGVEAESLFEAKTMGPNQLKVQERAITTSDYSDLVKNKFKEIKDAKTQFIYTGSWNTIKVSIDLNKSLLDEHILHEVIQYVNKIKMVGHEVQIQLAEYVYPDINITIFVERGYNVEDIESRLNLILGDNVDDVGNKGFFHSDNFSFGTPLYVSKLFDVIEQIPGINYIVMNRFRKFYGDLEDEQKRDSLTKRNLKQGYIPIDEHQILRMENNPKHPEKGRLVVNFEKILDKVNGSDE